ncbi:MAG TPA: 30S ribosomal protein S6 [Desulfomonilaceae bacterium]|nr:30S ribosomal protein S6 [Desulfomonilaceae bacterium]
MRRYECVVILEPELPDDDIKNFTEKYSQLIKTSSGEVIKVEDWGIKRLAYLVKKKDKGRYILFDFVGVPSLISEMERQLKIAEEVMKYLSVKLEDSVELEAFKAAREVPPAPAPEAAALPETTGTEEPEAPAQEAAVEAEQQPAEAEEPAQAVAPEEGKEGQA